VASGVLGIGTAALGVVALLAGEPVGWSIATLLLSLATGVCALSRERRVLVRVLPFVVGAALVVLGGIGFVGTSRPGFVLAAAGLGLLTLVVGTLAEYPELLGGPRPPHRREVTP